MHGEEDEEEDERGEGVKKKRGPATRFGECWVSFHVACRRRLMRKPTCDSHSAGSQSPGRKLLTRGGAGFSKVLPPPPKNSPPSSLFEQVAARRRHLKVARATGKGGVSFFFISESERLLRLCASPSVL